MQDEINIQESNTNQKSSNTIVIATFVKKNSCLVARTVSFDTAAMYLLTFSILEPYPSKDIELDLNHFISH